MIRTASTSKPRDVSAGMIVAALAALGLALIANFAL
jgi:hypothetical protein